MTKATALTYKYLQFVPFQSLVNWSVAHLLNRDLGFTQHYPLIRIGEVIHRSIIPVNVEDNIRYKQITLKTNGGGAVLRDQKFGKDIGTKKQYLAKEGQFIMSKIDARNGAFGVVTEDLNNAIVTGDFPLYDVNTEKANPFYLYLLSTTRPFVNYAQSCSRGTTNRQRIDIEAFLSLQIPLPPLEEQNAIVAAYYNSLALAEQYEQQAEQASNEIEMYLLETLGISKAKAKRGQRTCYLEFYNYTDIEQWGIDFIRKMKIDDKSSLYKRVRLSDICQISSGGTPSRSRREYYNGNILWVKTGELKNEVLYDTEEKITQLGLNNSSAKLYPAGSLLIAMYGATIGQTAKLGVEATTNQACAVLYDIDNTFINTDYLWLYLQSQTEKLKSMAYGGAQPNINAGIVANYLIPLPPLNIQNKIVIHITQLKEQIQSLRTLAATTRTAAIQQFEQAIFE